jgi:hypothetical protein
LGLPIEPEDRLSGLFEKVGNDDRLPGIFAGLHPDIEIGWIFFELEPPPLELLALADPQSLPGRETEVVDDDAQIRLMPRHAAQHLPKRGAMAPVGAGDEKHLPIHRPGDPGRFDPTRRAPHSLRHQTQVRSTGCIAT